jgi:hypothetical protein
MRERSRAGVVPAVLLLLAAPGCVSPIRLLEGTSARLTGCAAEDVVVTHVQRSGTRVRAWDATCRDRAWACANDGGHLACVAMASAQPAPTAGPETPLPR